eukprot:11222730-Lingulodinium_polyedra.AAC.1
MVVGPGGMASLSATSNAMRATQPSATTESEWPRFGSLAASTPGQRAPNDGGPGGNLVTVDAARAPVR